jgi:hypothetical protein
MDGILLYGAQKSDKIDKWLKADNVSIAELKKLKRRTSR